MGDDPLCGPSGPSNTPPLQIQQKRKTDLSTLYVSNSLRLLIKNFVLQAHSPTLRFV
jgi:hypothetical protein